MFESSPVGTGTSPSVESLRELLQGLLGIPILGVLIAPERKMGIASGQIWLPRVLLVVHLWSFSTLDSDFPILNWELRLRSIYQAFLVSLSHPVYLGTISGVRTAHLRQHF